MACYAYSHYADVHPALLQPPSEERPKAQGVETT